MGEGEGDRDVSAEARSAKAEAVEGAGRTKNILKKIVIPAKAGTQMFESEGYAPLPGTSFENASTVSYCSALSTHLGPRLRGDDTLFCHIEMRVTPAWA
jgi:hypothetical protein